MKKYITDNKFELYLFFIILIGIILRLYNLDARPIHHDESLHAIYGQYIYNDFNTGFYKYDPMLHGPLLYNLLPFIYQIFGISDWAARILPCLLGIFMLFWPLMLKQKLKPVSIIIATAFISFSPTLIYWSRFLRHDYLIITFIFLFIYNVSKRKMTLLNYFMIPVFFWLCFTVKENAYLMLTIGLGYLIYRAGIAKFLKENIPKHKLNRKLALTMIIGILIGFFIYALLYSAGFRHMDGIIDGLYRKSLGYWITQHKIDRIVGPFSFHFFILSWYDLPFIGILIFHTIHFYKNCHKNYQSLFFITFILSVVLRIIFKDGIPSDHFLNQSLKIKYPFDFYLFLLLIVHSIVLTTNHLLRRENTLAFLGYFFFATFFSYSFAGEKVPWLTAYIYLTGLFYFIFYFQEKNLIPNELFPSCKSIAGFFLIVATLHNLRMSIITNFSRAGASTELISQVHTSEQLSVILKKIKKEMETPTEGYWVSTLVLKEAIWPSTWYLYGKQGFQFTKSLKKIEEYDYVITDSNDNEVKNIISQSHNIVKLPLRAWWVPDYDKLSLKNFLNYAFSHNPWNSTGSSDIYFAKKRK